MKKRIVVCLVLLSAIFCSSLANTSPVSAAESNSSTIISPQVFLDCGIYVYTPYKSGDYVWGDALISCATSHPSLKIVAGIADRIPPDQGVNRYNSVSNTCYNTSSCTATAPLSYVALRQWQADGSAYQGSYWNAYLQSSWVAVNP